VSLVRLAGSAADVGRGTWRDFHGMLLMSTLWSPLGQAALAYAAKGFRGLSMQAPLKAPLDRARILDATFNTGQITELVEINAYRRTSVFRA